MTTLMYCVNRDVMSFESCYEALAYIESKHKLDIIITDADMPDMDGFELLTRIKTNYPQKKFIIMSDSPDKEQTASRMGADAFLAKPFGLKDLFEIVETFVINGN